MSQEVVADKNWREEGNPLDLNNLPEDNNYTTRSDGKQTSGDTSSSAGGGCRKKKRGGGKEDGKGDDGKVYECRFCSLKFCKSQALGGHMNRHRQERETETLNKARQLVFTNDLAPVHHLGFSSNGQPIPSSHGLYHHHHQQQQQQARQFENTGLMPPQLFRPMYPPPPSRIFSNSSPPQQPQPQATYTYPPPAPMFTFQTATQSAAANEYFMGHTLNYGGATTASNEMCNNNYTCIGTPVVGLGPESTAARDRGNEVEGLNNWGRR